MVTLQSLEKVLPNEVQVLANNYAIAKNVRDAFPHPYDLNDAIQFLEIAKTGVLGNVFGIFYNQTFVGMGGIVPKTDIHRINGEIGYWLGEPYWGKGYATQTARLLTDIAFNKMGLLRVYAEVFEYNTASMRVLEKAGYKKEAIIKSSIIKSGKIYDEHLYSMLKNDYLAEI